MLEIPKGIDFVEYSLRPKPLLGAVNVTTSRAAKVGLLLRFQFGDQSLGYSSIQSWTEFGDETLDELKTQLRSIPTLKDESAAFFELSALVRRSWYHALEDSVARKEGRSLFSALAVPRSHCLILSGSEDLLRDRLEIMSDAWAEGFTSFKLKAELDLSRELSFWGSLDFHIWLQRRPKAKFRIDFNAQLEERQYRDFVASFPNDISNYIDYIEDPVPYSEIQWAQLPQVPRLAADFIPWLEDDLETRISAPVLIIKPARQDAQKLASFPGKISVTSYLDHPLGQAAAAWEAGRLMKIKGKDLLTCGLQSHLVYEPNEFSDLLGKGAEWSPPPGHGFGFDDELAAQGWKKLV
jgi:o-succinylbenzoate synthase